MNNRQIRISFLEKSMAENPSDPFIKYALAMEYREEDLDRSKSLLESLMEEQPEYVPTYLTLSNLLLDFGEDQRAKEILQSGLVMAKRANDTQALRELSDVLRNLEIEGI